MTDFRALCAELASALAEHQDKLEDEYHPDHPESARLDAISRLLDCTRAALAQAEPQEASDEAIMRLACISLGYEYTPSLISNPENGIGALEALPSELLAFARAVLARWGTPANTTNQED